ncbi:MAG: hypothetical protein Q8K58_04665 [Acidimicrobiales bacterium]|nr:hypothetical protein [Acidimicrobiales bacterium]
MTTPHDELLIAIGQRQAEQARVPVEALRDLDLEGGGDVDEALTALRAAGLVETVDASGLATLVQPDDDATGSPQPEVIALTQAGRARHRELVQSADP